MGRRWRVRAVLALATLASAVIVFAAPSPAHAAMTPVGPVRCADHPDIVWVQTGGSGWIKTFTGYKNYQLVSATPTFDVSEGRIVENGLDTPSPATFTSTMSRTVTLQVSLGVTHKVAEFLSSQLNVSVIEARTTSIGVSVTVTVPPRSRVLGEYGLASYDVVYDAQAFGKIGGSADPNSAGSCIAGNLVRGTGHAPTVTEGWRFNQV